VFSTIPGRGLYCLVVVKFVVVVVVVVKTMGVARKGMGSRIFPIKEKF